MLGLSPRVRGNPYAGFGVCHLPGVYPRECGGTNVDNSGPSVDNGLSPRVRGNLETPIQLFHRRRSIPASAGEPHHSAKGDALREVYPRECGGTADPTSPPAEPLGLSPRVRGNREFSRGNGERHGSIPASAGEPIVATRLATRQPVYPRECGGTQQLGDGVDVHLGLSPRVRGNRLPPRPGILWRRSIPASAGEPFPTGPPVATFSVYPRECGGTMDPPSSNDGGSGLSPRVRGNPPVFLEVGEIHGSIPASAGEP